jgi:glycosyltransferase involved in cell wall biosynthesis
VKICLFNLGALPALSQEHKHQRIGGEEVQHAQLAAALARLGHDVSLVVADSGQPKSVVLEGIRILKAHKETAGLPGLRFIYPRWVKMWSAIARADADVYYTSCAGMIVGMLAMYCKLRRKRLVFRTAIDSDCEPDDLLIRYRRDRWLYEYGLRRADVILVQTVTQQRSLKKNYGLEGILADMLVAKPLSRETSMSKDIDILWIANLRHIKRPDRLLELARAMPGYRFHMAGGPSPGEEDLFQRIEAEARAIPNLTFHGAVPYFDVGGLFARARTFANTSDLEGFPNTFLQSWVRGIPVVTMFDPDGVVRRERLGSAHATVRDMAAGLDLLLRSPDAYSVASFTAKEFMRQRFGDDRVLAPYISALSGIGTTRELPGTNGAIAAADSAVDCRRR